MLQSLYIMNDDINIWMWWVFHSCEDISKHFWIPWSSAEADKTCGRYPPQVSHFEPKNDGFQVQKKSPDSFQVPFSGEPAVKLWEGRCNAWKSPIVGHHGRHLPGDPHVIVGRGFRRHHVPAGAVWGGQAVGWSKGMVAKKKWYMSIVEMMGIQGAHPPNSIPPSKLCYLGSCVPLDLYLFDRN